MNRLITLYISIILAANTVIAEDHRKRAPSGFTGVRGKKSISGFASDSIIDNSECLENLLRPEDCSVAVSDGDSGAIEKRMPSGFMGMRGKKPLIYVQPWKRTYPDALYKGTTSGFMTLRGNKDNEYVGYGAKRVSSGFMGMRGKKEISYPYLRTSHYDSDKRTPMGFLGVRGKKSYADSLLSDGKRAPSGFFGMRGKKHPSGFFGMRGKKYPYEFRGKFVGVRGKKMSHEITGPDNYSNLDLKQLGEKLDINQLMLLLTEQDGPDNRSPSENRNSMTRQ